MSFNKASMCKDLSPYGKATARIVQPNFLSYKDEDGCWTLRYVSYRAGDLDYRADLRNPIENILNPYIINLGDHVYAMDLLKYNNNKKQMQINVSTKTLSRLDRYNSGPTHSMVHIIHRAILRYAPIHVHIGYPDWVFCFPGVYQPIVSEKPINFVYDAITNMDGNLKKWIRVYQEG